MDNNKLLIGLIVGVVAFFGAPFVLQVLRQQAPAVAPAAASPVPAAAAQNAVAAPQMPAAPAQPQPAYAPSAGGLDAQSLVGTMWEVSAPQGTIKFQFNAGGQGVAMHAFLGQMPASWTCSGNAVNVTLTVMGKPTTVSATIQGNSLVGQGCNIRRLQ